MKSRILKMIFPFFIAGVLFSCKKEGENVFNMFEGVTVTFNANSPYSITGYKEVNNGDSVYIDFTIRSADKDMYEVWFLEAGQNSPKLKIPIRTIGAIRMAPIIATRGRSGKWLKAV